MRRTEKPSAAVLGTILLCFACSSVAGQVANRDASAKRALEWLTAHVSREAWRTRSISRGNEVGKRDFTEAVIAYLLQLYPEERRWDSLRERLDVAMQKRLARHPVAFGSWEDGAAALYMAESGARAGKPHASLGLLARRVADRQNVEGGWARSGGGLGFYPSTLVATTNFAMLGLALATEAGVWRDSDVVAEGVALLRDVQASSGGMPYGGRPYQKGVEAGRTGGTLLAFAALGLSGDEAAKRAATYLRGNIASIPDGHASAAIHVALGSLACRLAGEDCEAAFRDIVSRRILAAQRTDGAFEDILGQSPDSMRMMGLESTATAYLTALYTVALTAERSKFVAGLQPVTHRWRPRKTAPVAASRWDIALPQVKRFASGEAGHVAATTDGNLVFFDDEGEVRSRIEEQENAVPMVVGDAVYVWRGAGPSALVDPTEDLSSSRGGVAAQKGYLRRFELATGKLVWSRSTPGIPQRVSPGPEGLVILYLTGRCEVHDYRDGRRVKRMSIKGSPFATTVHALPGPVYCLGVERKLFGFDAEGDEIWSRKTRTPRGLVGAMVTDLATRGSVVHSGRSDGTLTAREVTEGDKLHRTRLSASVVDLVAGSDAVYVVCSDGLLHAVRRSDYEILWAVDVFGGGESLERSRLVTRGDRLLVASPARGRILDVDTKTGSVTREFECPAGNPWGVGRETLVVGRGERVHGFALSLPRQR